MKSNEWGALFDFFFFFLRVSFNATCNVYNLTRVRLTLIFDWKKLSRHINNLDFYDDANGGGVEIS